MFIHKKVGVVIVS